MCVCACVRVDGFGVSVRLCECAPARVLQVEDVDVEHVTLDVNEYTGTEDKHLVYVDTSGDRVVVYSTGLLTCFGFIKRLS